jgi:hypothetical protein
MHDSESFKMTNGIALSATIMMQLTYHVKVQSFSLKFLYLSVCLASYLTFAHYTADLTGRMTSGPREIAIRAGILNVINFSVMS